MPDELDALAPKRVALKSLNRGSLIAEGGFAHIYNANSSDGAVVLRILKREHRFSRKMRTQFGAGVAVRRNCGRHPNIVNYLAEGGSLLTCPFEVLELVNGKSMKTLIFDRHPQIVGDPVNILRQCAAAMMHIHQIGYLHLDIKPENYLVEFRDGKPCVKLTDFDLCLPAGASQAPKGFGGSPMYLAPEYLTAKRISVASDIFAFGVMAFNLCTGQMPYVGSVESIMRDGGYQITFPHSISCHLTDRIRGFILKCLSKNPKQRFQDGGDLFVNLEEIVREDAKDLQRAKLGI